MRTASITLTSEILGSGTPFLPFIFTHFHTWGSFALKVDIQNGKCIFRYIRVHLYLEILQMCTMHSVHANTWKNVKIFIQKLKKENTSDI